MADLKAFKELIKITSLNGMSTNPPQGFVRAATYSTIYQWRPYRLENVDFSRAPGWQSMPGSSLQVAALSAQSTLIGADLWTWNGTNLNYYDATTRTSATVVGLINPLLGVSLMPGLLMSYSDGTQPPLTSAGSTQRPTTSFINQIVLKNGIYDAGGPGTAGDVTVTYDVAAAGPPAEVGFSNAATYEFYVTYNTPNPNTAGHFSQQRYFYFTNPGGLGANFIPVINYTSGIGSIGGAVWYRLSGTSDAWQVGLVSTSSSGFSNGRVQKVSLGLPSGASAYFAFKTDPAMPHEYHQGRIFIVPSRYQYFDSSGLSSGIQEDGSPTRIIYSNVIATASSKSFPSFSVANYIDVPFVVSKKIVALKSTGRYLYIFGDRELLILTGNSDKDFTLESLGDSLGAVSGGSVQRLGSSVYWMSDSGAMKVSGGTVAEIGEDVRPTLLAMDMTTMTSTVDFGNEIYYLKDATSLLCYWVREDAWTYRVDGTLPSALLYGGGTPYALKTGSGVHALNGLKDLNGLTPPWLQVLANFSPHSFDGKFDGWTSRKIFREILLGVETPSDCFLSITAFANEAGASVSVPAHLVSGGPYTRRVAFGLKALSGNQLGFQLILTPPAQPSVPALLSPPLCVTGDIKGETN